MATAVTSVKNSAVPKYRLVRGVVPAARWYEPLGFLSLAYLAIFLVIVLPILFSFLLSVYDIRNSNIRMVLNKIGINVFALPFLFPDLFKGLDNYLKLLQDKDFIGTFIRSIIWTGVNVFFHVSIGVWLATLLNRKLPGKSLFYVLLILPWAIPQYIAATTWKGMFNAQFGIIPAIFEAIGVNNTIRFAFGMQDVSWLANPYLNFVACILVNIWLGFPFMMMIALGGLQTISSDYYEAADIDGASGWQKFNYITLPLLMPIMVPAIILGTVWTFNMVNIIYIFADAGRVSEEAHILVTKMYVDGLQYFRYSYASAIGVFIFVILTIFAVLYMKATVKED